MVKKNFFDLKAPIYQNKKNGQISLVLPRKKLKKIMEHNEKIPKSIPIRVFWWKKREI
jgi:hypothetical protein